LLRPISLHFSVVGKTKCQQITERQFIFCHSLYQNYL
jgi:hypothetical protein